MTPESPLSRYAIQIVGLILILPVILALGLSRKIGSDLIAGLFGTIIGFFFGGALSGRHQGREGDRG